MSVPSVAVPASAARTRKWLGLLPSWMQTIRVRLTVTYSVVLFGVAALVVIGVYVVLTRALDAEPLDVVEMPASARKDDVGVWHVEPGGATFQAADIESVERAANYKTLRLLRELSLQALGVLFVASLVTGWWLAGRVLRPVRHITRTAEEISATDLSRRIQLEGPDDELRQLGDTLDGMLGRLENAFSTQHQIVGDASHELRNPLAVIQANVDAILARSDVTPEERSTSAAVVVRATGRMTRLIEDLLASARRSSPAFVDSTVDLADVATDVVGQYRALAEQRDLVLRCEVIQGATAAGDPRAITRAVDNLLSNAVRLAPPDSTISVSGGTRDGWAWISVADEGPGIPLDEQAQIFNRFYRGSRGVARTHPSGRVSASNEHVAGDQMAMNSGLGLAIVRQIVESHDGTVTLRSVVGVGSTFTLWLPDVGVPAPERAVHPPSLQPVG